VQQATGSRATGSARAGGRTPRTPRRTVISVSTAVRRFLASSRKKRRHQQRVGHQQQRGQRGQQAELPRVAGRSHGSDEPDRRPRRSASAAASPLCTATSGSIGRSTVVWVTQRSPVVDAGSGRRRRPRPVARSESDGDRRQAATGSSAATGSIPPRRPVGTPRPGAPAVRLEHSYRQQDQQPGAKPISTSNQRRAARSGVVGPNTVSSGRASTTPGRSSDRTAPHLLPASLPGPSCLAARWRRGPPASSRRPVAGNVHGVHRLFFHTTKDTAPGAGPYRR